MSKHQDNDSAREEKDVAGKATDDNTTEKKGDTEKQSGKDNTVLADLNGEPSRKAK